MANLSPEEARKIIAEVREDNGGITAEDRDFLAEHRPSALRALQKTRRQLADSIKIVVDNLYSKETRFLYELIQNAEDNSYSTAMKEGKKPFLAFEVYPDRIIVSSNEDGFSESNIRAICSVGNSTKKHSAGYIGEKGIGFKSVFKIAQKVHVQSGSFSFAFSHTREDDDDGLGMITPYHENAKELARGMRTCMTLTLLDSTKFEERASEFRGIPDTFLMFLGQLQRLSIVLHQPNEAPTVTHYSKRETKENGLYTSFLAKTTRKGKEESASEQKYYTMKSDLRDLPFDDARKDNQGNSINQATVILAFPVDEHDEPVVKQQYTYAFLPLRRVGFSFLIQSDFVTQANREDVVHSKRNQAVLKGVAKAFTDAMVVFCKRPSLRYQWMRYLPGDFITDEFWGTLWTLVRGKLEQTPLLEPWSGNGLYKPSNLEKLTERLIAKDRNPLLLDLEGAEVYLSPKYTNEDFQILKRLGTTTLQWSKLVDRLDADLRNSGGSKWKAMKGNADWRTRICDLLSRAFTGNLLDQQKDLRKLALIPLYDGRWVSSASGIKVYFPETAGVSIPTDLGLDLVHPMAVENVAWANLLSNLGVTSCLSDTVIKLIYDRYDAASSNKYNVFNAVAHIRYLYWFLPNDLSSLAPQVRLVNQHGSLLKKDQYLYFPDEGDDCSPSNLFKQDAQLPGHPVHYLHEDYLKAVDPGVIHNGRPWRRWLEEVVGVWRIPVFRAEGSDRLSKEFKYIISYRSDRLLRTLKHGWARYRLLINDIVEGQLWNSAVSLENGHRTALLRTFLPFPKLKQVAAELCIADAYPFIAMSELLRDEERLEWAFVKDLRVGIEEDLYFYLSALKTFKEINAALNTISARDQLARIYQNIQSKSNEGLDNVLDMFKHPVIWIEPSNRIDSSWLSTSECVWDGPQWLKSKQCLKHDGYLELEHLFKVSLRMPDASQADILDDLLMLKGHREDKHALRSQSTAKTPPNTGSKFGGSILGDAAVPYQLAPVQLSNGTPENFQSITSMEAYEVQSFEEFRLLDYYVGRKPLSTKASFHKSKAFAGLETHKIIEEAEKRYDYLYQKGLSAVNDENLESRKALRFTFEDSALVYIPKENAWLPPSQCVWVESSMKIPGKASIASAYPSKKAFFTKVLKIPEPTVEMYVESLKAEAKGKASAAHIKETMALICGLISEETDLSSLVEAKVLPVRLANGGGSLASASSKDEFIDFAIVENRVHWDAFKGKIVALDFSLEEIRDTRPLLLAMGLENRFPSKLVKEVTDVNGGFPDHGMTRNLRLKSQAIVRCAFHFASLNKRQALDSLYRKFRRATVYQSDSIGRSLRITQNGRSIEGASSRANFHFEEIEGALRLYLPKDKVKRDVCFESDLPRRLCVYLDITDPGAPGVIGGVFRQDNPAVIDEILENAGVGQVDCDFTASDEELGLSEGASDVKTLVEATSNVRLSTLSPGPRPYTPSGWARWRERQSGSANAEGVRDTSTPSPSYQERQREVQESAYKSVLENTVNVARQRVHSGVLETTGISNRDPIATKALPREIIRDAFAAGTQQRDFKLGAAGELYMFEYLKGLVLPGFGLENWKSGIRDRVKIHAGYQDLEPNMDRSAIADIEFLDDSRRLTQFLTQKGHLAQGLWDSERPLYHIEVKTTTSSDWQEPFFMSKYQERHVQDKRIEDGKSRSSIYIICRIFNLGKGDETGMHIYLDPETRRRNRELDFSTHTWAVRPLSHPYMPASNGFARASAAQTAATAGRSVVTKVVNAPEESVVPGFTDLGSSATNSVSSNNDLGTQAVGTGRPVLLPSTKGTLGSSTLGSRTKTESSKNTADPTSGSTTLNFGVLSSPLPEARDRTTSTGAVSTGGSFGSFASSGPVFGTSRPSSLGGGLFGSNSAPSGNNASTHSPSAGSSIATTKPVLMAGNFSVFDRVSSNSNTSKTPSPGLFGSNATSSNSDASIATPKGGLFGSNVMSINDNTSKASSPGIFFGATTSSSLFGGATTSSSQSGGATTSSSQSGGATTSSSLFGGATTSSSPFGGTSTITTGFSGFGPSILFGMNGGNPESDSYNTPSVNGLFGTKAASLNSETSKTTSSTYSFGTAEPLSSLAPGRLISTNPSSSNNRIPETTAASISTGAVKPSSSTATGAIFGTTVASTESMHPQGVPSSSGFRVSFSTPRGSSSTNAATSSSPNTSKGTANTKVTKAMPTTSSLFGSTFVPDDFNVSRETSTSTIFGSTTIAETASTSKPTTSNAPSVLASAHSANPFQSSLSKDNIFAHLSTLPSPSPSPTPGMAQALKVEGDNASPKPAAAATRTPVAGHAARWSEWRDADGDGTGSAGEESSGEGRL